ncbi:MAG: N(4)-(beta-N-acetylglucosaminyl)-L-asparaginase [Planctomycetota bacterium]
MRLLLFSVWVLMVVSLGRADESRLPCFVSTWNFGKAANQRAMEVLAGGGDLLDAVEQGIRVTEADVANSSVGIGGTPNAEGIVQLDACIMDGRGHQAGGVAALEGIRHPITAARLVMEKSPHVLLVGDGARRFALQHGAEEAELLTDDRAKAWEQWRESQRSEKVSPQNHDTIAMIGIDREGNVVGGCSTSGMGYKLPGRVGDSPIFGSGLYVDNEVGGAGATGVGENVMRYCGTFMIVEAMRHGMSPQEACEMAIRRIERLDPLGLSELHVNFVAVNKQGELGAAGTDQGFHAAISNPSGDFVREPAILTESKSSQP